MTDTSRDLVAVLDADRSVKARWERALPIAAGSPPGQDARAWSPYTKIQCRSITYPALHRRTDTSTRHASCPRGCLVRQRIRSAHGGSCAVPRRHSNDVGGDVGMVPDDGVEPWSRS